MWGFSLPAALSPRPCVYLLSRGSRLLELGFINELKDQKHSSVETKLWLTMTKTQIIWQSVIVEACKNTAVLKLCRICVWEGKKKRKEFCEDLFFTCSLELRKDWGLTSPKTVKCSRCHGESKIGTISFMLREKVLRYQLFRVEKDALFSWTVLEQKSDFL